MRARSNRIKAMRSPPLRMRCKHFNSKKHTAPGARKTAPGVVFQCIAFPEWRRAFSVAVRLAKAPPLLQIAFSTSSSFLCCAYARKIAAVSCSVRYRLGVQSSHCSKMLAPNSLHTSGLFS